MRVPALCCVCLAVAAWPASQAGEPAAEAAGMKLRVLTWNVQYGSERGADPNGWPERKAALRAALADEKPDVLCVQEALAGQLEFIDGLLPGHKRVGVGRDDGAKAGEHCAVFFDARRFEAAESGTFWLSETPEKPSRGWGEKYMRICTWVRLREPASGRAFRVYGTHLALLPSAREKSAALIVERIAKVPRDEPVILAGDFNCGPGSPPWKLFGAAGLKSAEELAGRRPGAATYHKSGIPLVCLDAVFASGTWKAGAHRVVRGQAGAAWASDHFGVAADLELPAGPKGPGGAGAGAAR